MIVESSTFPLKDGIMSVPMNIRRIRRGRIEFYNAANFTSARREKPKGDTKIIETGSTTVTAKSETLSLKMSTDFDRMKIVERLASFHFDTQSAEPRSLTADLESLDHSGKSTLFLTLFTSLKYLPETDDPYRIAHLRILTCSNNL